MTLIIHPTAKISDKADIEDSVRGTKIEICENVSIDSFVKVKPAGGNGEVYIGPNASINSGCVFYTGNGIFIGSNVAIAANCTFAPTNHEYARTDIPIMQQGFRPSKGGIRIGNDVWIGSNCVFLDGTVIGDGCIIGAGSIVRGVLDPYKIYAGNPVKVIKDRKGD